jgi:iron-sulfur cluster repair protein YtfE (RIC family)
LRTLPDGRCRAPFMHLSRRVMKEDHAMKTMDAQPIQGLATELFRREHLEIKESLIQVGNLVGKLYGQPGLEARIMMDDVVRKLQKDLSPHAEWEERVLYPIIDRHAASGSRRFTATMRYEHTIIARQLADLEIEAHRPTPDAKRFARHADQLLGLIHAHFEEEEEVLLDVLDSSMTAEEFKRAIIHEEERAAGAGGLPGGDPHCHLG